MKSTKKLKLWTLATAIVAGFLFSANVAYSGSCAADLAKAEKRWSKFQDQFPSRAAWVRKVTRRLDKAAGFKQEGREGKCLRQIRKANENMDIRESKG